MPKGIRAPEYFNDYMGNISDLGPLQAPTLNVHNIQDGEEYREKEVGGVGQTPTNQKENGKAKRGEKEFIQENPQLDKVVAAIDKKTGPKQSPQSKGMECIPEEISLEDRIPETTPRHKWNRTPNNPNKFKRTNIRFEDTENQHHGPNLDIYSTPSLNLRNTTKTPINSNTQSAMERQTKTNYTNQGGTNPTAAREEKQRKNLKNYYFLRRRLKKLQN